SSGHAVGRTIRIGSEGPGKPDLPREVVGVVRDVKTGGLADGDLATPEIYVPEAQMPLPVLMLAIRTSHGDPMALAPDVRAAVRAIDPELPVSSVMTMDERIGASLRTQRFRTLIIAAFAVLAALLACLGVYAVRARAVAARVREMGIRVALGATGAQVV